jgi:hypothetical protein
MPSLPYSMDADGVRKMIREKMEALGCTLKEMADMDGVSPAYLSDILHGRREPGKKVLDAHGMKKCVYYEFKEG